MQSLGSIPGLAPEEGSTLNLRGREMRAAGVDAAVRTGPAVGVRARPGRGQGGSRGRAGARSGRTLLKAAGAARGDAPHARPPQGSSCRRDLLRRAGPQRTHLRGWGRRPGRASRRPWRAETTLRFNRGVGARTPGLRTAGGGAGAAHKPAPQASGAGPTCARARGQGLPRLSRAPPPPGEKPASREVSEVGPPPSLRPFDGGSIFQIQFRGLNALRGPPRLPLRPHAHHPLAVFTPAAQGRFLYYPWLVPASGPFNHCSLGPNAPSLHSGLTRPALTAGGRCFSRHTLHPIVLFIRGT